jgi:hypothetical protein
VTTYLANNGSLWVHFYLFHSESSPDPNSEDYNHSNVIRHSAPLVRYLKRIKTTKKKKLIKNEQDQQENEEVLNANDIISYYWHNVSLEIVANNDPMQLVSLHANVKKVLRIENGRYYPIFETNDFWMLKEDLIAINDTLKSLDFSFSFSPVVMWKHSILVAMVFIKNY